MSNYTILLIDYEPKSIDRVRRPLMAIGYRVEVATDGISGIEAFHRIKPDLVMVEAMIPKKHGFEVCQEIKKSPQGKRTPVIITTSVYKGRKYRNQAFHLHGCDEYIEKPIDEEQVVTICRRMVGDNSPIQPIETLVPPPETFETDSAFEVDGRGGFAAGAAVDGAHAEFPPVPPAPPGMDDDEFEIMSKLDSILSGPMSSARPSAPAQQHQPTRTSPPPLPTLPSGMVPAPRDLFATSFFPSTDSAQNQDFAPHPLGSSGSATATAEPQFLVPIGESPEQSVAPANEPGSTGSPDSSEFGHDSASPESHRAKKKERRKKGAASSPREAASPTADPGSFPAITEHAPSPESFATADLPPAPIFAEPDAPRTTESRVDPFDTPVDDDESGSRWFMVAVVVILLGAAVALFMYMR